MRSMAITRTALRLGPPILLAAFVAVVGAAGCKSLPFIVPDLALRPGSGVRLAGVRGPLTAAQSETVLKGLAERGEPTDIFQRHLALEEAVAGSPLTVGNAVVLLKDGPTTYRAMLQAIESARDHIHLETYIFDDDAVGHRFADALLRQRQRGVAVHVIRDSVGTLSTPEAFFQRLADGGVQVLAFNPVNPAQARGEWLLNERNHRKLLIVDGRVAFLGGINISSVYSGGSFRHASSVLPGNPAGWRDTDLQLRGPVVADFQRLFLATWEQQRGPPLPDRIYFPALQKAGNDVVRAIGSSPQDEHSLIYITLLSAIGSAQTSIRLTNAYFVPDPQLLDALEAAAARGVDVVLVLPSQSDSWLVLNAGRSHYERLLRQGVKIHERRGVVLHSKTALVDGVWATVGSTNLDWRSFLHNHELNAVVLGAGFGEQLQRMFDQDLAVSDPIVLADWERRPLHQRMREAFALVWAYWL